LELSFMADVFVSYARLDFKVAKALASGLISRGYQVWWDTELVGGDDFRQIILDELTAAKAAIVIWSANSVKSRFVQDEAARALKAGKLISTNVDGFDVKQLPLGFGGQHCHPVADFKSTEEALRKRGIKTEQAKPINEQGALRSEASVWAAIENSTDPEEFKPTQAQPNQALVEYCADKRNSKISTFLGWFSS
jgi:hypothetical protein